MCQNHSVSEFLVGRIPFFPLSDHNYQHVTAPKSQPIVVTLANPRVSGGGSVALGRFAVCGDDRSEHRLCGVLPILPSDQSDLCRTIGRERRCRCRQVAEATQAGF